MRYWKTINEFHFLFLFVSIVLCYTFLNNYALVHAAGGLVAVITTPGDTVHLVNYTVEQFSGIDSPPSGANNVITDWFWDFGDGTNDTGAQVQHVYTTPGAHTITLIVRDDTGATATTTTSVTSTVPNFGWTRYVSSSGSNSNNGSDAAHPYLTMNKAFETWKQYTLGTGGTVLGRILVERGTTVVLNTYAASGGMSDNPDFGPIIIEAYGTGALPIIATDPGVQTGTSQNHAPASTYGYFGYWNNLRFVCQQPSATVSTSTLVMWTSGSQVTNSIFERCGLNAQGYDSGHPPNPKKYAVVNTTVAGFGILGGCGVPCTQGIFASQDWGIIDRSNFTGSGSNNVFDHEIYFGAQDYVTTRRTIIDGTGAVAVGNLLKFDGTKRAYAADNDIRFGPEGIDGGSNDYSREASVIIERNKIHDLGIPGLSVGIWLDWINGTIIRDNLFWNIAYESQAIINVKSVSSNQTVKNVKIYHNTFGPSTAPLISFSDSYWTSVEFKNNIVYRNSGTTWQNIQIASSDLSKFTSDYNSFYQVGSANTTTNFALVGSSYSFLQWQSTFGKDTHSIYADPKFVSVSTNDFHLQSSSGAIDRGVSLPAVYRDYDRVVRPQGSGYDMGAYEYFSSGSCGDGSCNSGETFLTCPQDCPSHLTCQSNTCTRISGAGSDSCTPEGSVCGQYCGDGSCNNGETFLTCSQDCPSHLTCISNTCTQVSGSGSNDCSPAGSQCGQYCGNNICDGTENCGTCSDCACGSGLTCYSNACVDTDIDNDGYNAIAYGGTDCNDNNAAVNPGASEVCTDAIDNNCNALTDCSDLACSGSSSCGGSSCGDAILDTGEECDDGNRVNGDGCSAACRIEGLVGYWPFENSTVDISGAGNHGNRSGPSFTAGKIGMALEYNVSNAYLQVGTRGMFTTKGTIAIWGKSTLFNSGGALYGHTTTPPYANRIQIYTDNFGQLSVGLGNNHTVAANITTLAKNVWNHIALTWNTTSYSVYVNGILIRSATYAGLSSLNSSADIGNIGNPADRAQRFNGTLDDVRVYNRTLTAKDIASLAGASYCGDGVCSGNENTNTCPQDCGSGGDSSPPSGSIKINSNAPSTDNARVNLDMNYSDNQAVKDCAYANDDKVYGPYEACSSTKLFWLLTKQNGIRTVYYKIRDTSDNTAEFSDTIDLEVIHTATGFDGATTNFSAVNPYNITSLVVEKAAYGKINFTNVNPTKSIPFESAVTIANNLVRVDSALYGALNRIATVTLRGITFTTPIILKDGVSCSTSECVITSYVGGVLVFTVQGFSNYSSQEGAGCIDGDADGYFKYDSSFCLVGTDCNDNDASIHPTAADVCGDGIDQDCSGSDALCSFCGDGVCAGAETCALCEVDCGSCSSSPPPSGGGGGGGGGGSGGGASPTGGTCSNGQTRSCGIAIGACTPGVQTCQSGQWGVCMGSSLPQQEVCDGVDNDCNGDIDDLTCLCQEGQTKACGSNIGICTSGVSTCDAHGNWGSCIGGIQPKLQDICSNGLDDNCDSQIDENCGADTALVCQNGIKDVGEEGIDCGGTCPACTSLETHGLLVVAITIVVIMSLVMIGMHHV